MSSKPRWRHEDFFPIINSVVFKICKGRGRRWISHHKIVKELVKEPSIHQHFSSLASNRKEFLWLTSNMFQWFSQKITQYNKDPLSLQNYKALDIIKEASRIYERKRIGRVWAYRIKLA